MTYDIVINNVDVLGLDNAQSYNIGITGNLIQYIGSDAITGTDTIDGSNHLAAPGMVNAHTHIAMTLLRNYADDMVLMDWLQNKIWPAEANLTPEHVYWGTMLGIAEMIKSGTTAFADMYFEMATTAEVVAETGIRASLSRGLTGLDQAGDNRLAENIAFYKEWHNKADGRIQVRLGPHAPYTCPVDYLKKVITAAKELGCGLHMHLSETKGEVDACIKEHGMTPIALMDSLGMFELPTLAAHCVYVTDADMDIMAAKHVAVASNPQSNLKLASGIAPLSAMLNKNITVALGTDGASSNNNLDMLEELRLASVLAKTVTGDPTVIPANIAVELATSNGANALGFDNVGELKVGQKADIVLYDMHKPYWYPRHNLTSGFVYAANANDVDTVLVDGKILLAQGKLTTIDEEKTYAEANRLGLDLVNKA
ncbi:MAG: amidohydrolase [Acidaminococcaceae bacterium]|nr:amidohydrolase [Acidaminococcaceae bacterium]